VPGSFDGGLLNGGSLHSRAFAGSVIVVNFWASWCPPCVIETPQFELAYEGLRREHRQVEFVGINTKDTRSSARTFVHDNAINYPIVFDQDGNVALQLGGLPTPSLPDTVLIDKHGRIAGTYIGLLEPKDLEPMIARLFAEP